MGNDIRGPKISLNSESKTYKFTEKEDNEIQKGGTLNLYFSSSNIQVKEFLKEGGEGTIYECSKEGYVVKVLRPENRTTFRERKMSDLIKLNPHAKFLCWPEDLVYYNKKFIGILLPKVEGVSLKKLTQNPSRIEREYKDYDRTVQIKMIIDILNGFKFLHSKNILVGDVKLENIMFNPKNYHITFIDMDSVQFNEYPCLTSTIDYIPQEVLLSNGKDKVKDKTKNSNGDEIYTFYKYFGRFMRTELNEYYSISVLLYRLLMNGNVPYDCRDFGYCKDDVGEDYNLDLMVDCKFPYSAEQNQTAPDCQLKDYWSVLPSFLKIPLEETFGESHRRLSPTEWIKIFNRYLEVLPMMKKKKVPQFERVFPELDGEIDYELVKFPLSPEIVLRGFNMHKLVKKIVKQLENEELDSSVNDISNNLRLGQQYSVKKFIFNLDYNIGVLKKITAKCA